MIGLESENLQIDQKVTLNLSLSNLEISTTAIQRLTSNTLIVWPWKHLPGGIYVSLSLQISSLNLPLSQKPKGKERNRVNFRLLQGCGIQNYKPESDL